MYYYLKRIYQVNLEEMTVPSKTEIDLRRSEAKIEELVAEITGSISSEEIAPDTKALAARLLEREQSAELVQILLTHFKKRHQVKAAAGNPVGGLLKDVPKPEHIAPGSRRPTLAGIADRVATIRGEYRGLPGEGAGDSTESASENSETSKKPVKKASPKAKADDASSDRSEEAPRGRRRGSRRARDEDTPALEAKDSEESATSADDDKPARKPRRSRRTSDTPAESQEAQTSEQAADIGSEETEAPARKPRRSRRAATKASDSQTTASTSEPSEDSDPENEAPRRSRRRTRKREEETTVEANASEEKPHSSPPVVPDGMKRLYLNVGSRSRIDESGIRELIADLAGLSRGPR